MIVRIGHGEDPGRGELGKSVDQGVAAVRNIGLIALIPVFK